MPTLFLTLARLRLSRNLEISNNSMCSQWNCSKLHYSTHEDQIYYRNYKSPDLYARLSSAIFDSNCGGVNRFSQKSQAFCNRQISDKINWTWQTVVSTNHWKRLSLRDTIEWKSFLTLRPVLQHRTASPALQWVWTTQWRSASWVEVGRSTQRSLGWTPFAPQWPTTRLFSWPHFAKGCPRKISPSSGKYF